MRSRTTPRHPATSGQAEPATNTAVTAAIPGTPNSTPEPEQSLRPPPAEQTTTAPAEPGTPRTQPTAQTMPNGLNTTNHQQPPTPRHTTPAVTPDPHNTPPPRPDNFNNPTRDQQHNLDTSQHKPRDNNKPPTGHDNPTNPPAQHLDTHDNPTRRHARLCGAANTPCGCRGVAEGRGIRGCGGGTRSRGYRSRPRSRLPCRPVRRDCRFRPGFRCVFSPSTWRGAKCRIPGRSGGARRVGCGAGFGGGRGVVEKVHAVQGSGAGVRMLSQPLGGFAEPGLPRSWAGGAGDLRHLAKASRAA